MKVRMLSVAMLAAGLLAGCKEKSASGEPESGKFLAPPVVKAETDAGGAARENAVARQKEKAPEINQVADPVQEAIKTARVATRGAYNNRRFDELEAEAAQFRTSKATFGNGSWKIVKFYESLLCRDEDPDSIWQVHDGIHQEWIAAKPNSITARVAYIAFLTDYAWQARGSGYSDTVTKEGWEVFAQRLDAAMKVFVEARNLEEKDPSLWQRAMTIALGQGWDPSQYAALLKEARAFEPAFWGYETSRAYSLLPRWFGEEGDWEAFAAETAARPEGLGIELYARIVLNLRGYYENVFRETKASWPKTKEGLQVLMQKYPDSLGFLSESALLAVMAEDQPMAKELFAKLGDRYLQPAWKKPERFERFRRWAETGSW